MIPAPTVTLTEAIELLIDEAAHIEMLESVEAENYPARGFSERRLKTMSAIRMAYRTMAIMAFDPDRARKALEEIKAANG